MQPAITRHLFRILCPLACAAPLAADVLVVDASGGGDYLYPMAAIEAAAEGDTVLLRAGSHADFFVEGKSLFVVAETPGSVTCPGISIEDLAPNQRVVLSGLVLHGTEQAQPQALVIDNCAGAVRVENCVIEAADWDPAGILGVGYDGAKVIDSGAVSFIGCTLRGGAGQTADAACPGVPGQQRGGAGLRAQGSRVSLHQCDAAGGQGGHAASCAVAGPGGAGVSVFAGEVYAAGSQIAGGEGGMSFSLCACGGDGGPALALDGADAQLLDAALAPGLPAPGSFTGVPGAPTELLGGATASFLGGDAAALVAPGALTTGAPFSIAVQGQPGELAVLAASLHTGWLDVPALYGPVLLGFPLALNGLSLGVIGAGGEAALLLTAPSLPPGMEAAAIFLQAVSVDAGGAIRLTGARTLQVFAAGLLP